MPQLRAGSSGLCVTSSHQGNGVQTDHKQCHICLLHVFLVCSGNKAQHGGIVFPRNTSCLVLLGARGEENLSRVMGRLIHEPLRLCWAPEEGLGAARGPRGAAGWGAASPSAGPISVPGGARLLSVDSFPFQADPWACHPHACFYRGMLYSL